MIKKYLKEGEVEISHDELLKRMNQRGREKAFMSKLDKVCSTIKLMNETEERKKEVEETKQKQMRDEKMKQDEIKR